MRTQVRSLGVSVIMTLTNKEEEVKKFIVLILILVFFTISFGCVASASNGPAPNSGDGVSDGSGF